MCDRLLGKLKAGKETLLTNNFSKTLHGGKLPARLIVGRMTGKSRK